MEVHGTPGFGRDLLVEGALERIDCNGRDGRVWPGGDARCSTFHSVIGAQTTLLTFYLYLPIFAEG
jgi:hypothetical protein